MRIIADVFIPLALDQRRVELLQTKIGGAIRGVVPGAATVTVNGVELEKPETSEDEQCTTKSPDTPEKPPG